MKKDHVNRWQRIATFKLDDPNAARPFSTKLAEEQKWAADFTQRVIAEYKKFAFLCVTLPNGASPSPIIDAAWHLHLTYTDSYWNQFCAKIMETQLHHHPSKGGFDEVQKHDNWYRQTLIGYIDTFGHIPPDDIWTIPLDFDVTHYLPKDSPFLMQNVQNDLSRPRVLGGTEGVSETGFFENPSIWDYAAYVLIAVLFMAIVFPPLLKGTTFLMPFSLLGITIAVLIAQHHAQHKTLITKQLQGLTGSLSPYLGAWIAGGNERLMTTFLYEATSNCTFQPTTNTMVFQLKKEEALYKNPLYPLLETLEKPEISLTFIRESVKPYWQMIRSQIEKNGYQSASLTTKLGFLITAFCFLGFFRCVEGLFFHKNIGFLVITVIVSIIVLAIVHSVNALSFKDWRDRFTNHNKPQYATAQNNDMMWQFALGATLFTAGANWYGVENDLKPKHETYDSWGDGGSSSSCSGSSDGGSSCGGGCGGCGGGD